VLVGIAVACFVVGVLAGVGIGLRWAIKLLPDILAKLESPQIVELAARAAAKRKAA